MIDLSTLTSQDLHEGAYTITFKVATFEHVCTQYKTFSVVSSKKADLHADKADQAYPILNMTVTAAHPDFIVYLVMQKKHNFPYQIMGQRDGETKWRIHANITELIEARINGEYSMTLYGQDLRSGKLET